MSQYYKQLTSECPNPACLKIFCRRNYNNSTIEKVCKILSEYSDLFYCQNIPKLLEGSKIIHKYYILDLYFYIDNLFCSVIEDKKQTPRSFNLKKLKTSRKSENSVSSKTRKKRSDSIKPSSELEHIYCDVLNRTLSHVDIYLLIGVLQLLMIKFDISPDFNVALIIIRLSNTITKTSHLENSYYDTLLGAYEFAYKCFMNSVINSRLGDNQKCKYGNCLFPLSFTKADFKSSLNSVVNTLNGSFITDIRENPKIKNLLEILKILYKINEKVGLVDYEAFYLKEFCSHLNIKSEFRYLRFNHITAMKYDFILPIHIKSEILKLGNSDIMKSTLQDAFFRALFEGITEPYLFITIRRESIYEDTLRILRNFDDSDLKKQLKIKFLDEEGVDSGGIRKEYFQLLSHAITEDRSLFLMKNNRLWFQPGVNKENFFLIGKLVGIALYNDVVLSIPFPLLLFKKMLDIPLDFKDLAEIEPDIYNSIVNLEKCSEEEIKELDLFFCMDYECQGKRCVYELFPDGKNVQITKSNYLTFKTAYLEFFTSKVIQDEFEEFIRGFYTIIKKKTILNFRPKELEKIVMGLDDFDIEAIKRSTAYNGYTAEDEIIKHFWKIFDDYSLANKKKLLQFVTGNDRMPISGPESLKLIIMKNGCDTDRLPSTQTCFNTLLLPEYSSKEKLEIKLSKAIKMTAGFYLL